MATSVKTYTLGISALVGTTIGAGIFGVPYVFSRSGVLVGVMWCVIIGIVLTVANLLTGEFVLRSPDNMRFVGIARRYLGTKWGNAAGFLTLVGQFFSMVAYSILGGKFLSIIISNFIPVDAVMATVIYAIIISLVLSRSIKFVEKFDFPLVVILIVTILGLIGITIPHIAYDNLMAVSPKDFFLPYGVTLFALSSMSAIPAIKEVIKDHKHYLKSIIIYSGLISTIITLLFGLAVAGVTGGATSEEAIRGLSPYLGNSIITLGAVIGFLAVITSHLVIGDQQKQILHHDYHIPIIGAWFGGIILPYIFLLLIHVSFIQIMGFAGSIIGGITGIFVGVMALKSRSVPSSKPGYTVKNHNFWAYLIMIFFAFGIFYEIFYKLLV